VNETLRELIPAVTGVLVRRRADFAAAEDAVQEALIRALATWPGSPPADPKGWLITVAWRKFLDTTRAESSRHAREARAAAGAPPGPAGGTAGTLQLYFLCAHPSLTPASAVALTLRAVGGLTTRQIAEAYLVPEATMAQRISRAKRTVSGVRFSEPGDLATVLRVLYLVFNEGYSGEIDLADEAIRLTRQVTSMTGNEEASGLLALMLLHHARRAARTAPDGTLIPLAEQDRSRWDTRLIAEGVAILQAALARDRLGEYQAQAAIAALHADARTAEETDWVQIVEWYDELDRLTGSPVVRLNRAVAVGEADSATTSPGRQRACTACCGRYLRLRAASPSGEADGEGLQAVHQADGTPAEFLRADRKRQPREAGEHGTEGGLCLHPGQGSPEAVMKAVAEGEVTGRVPAEVQPVRVGEPAGIAVGGADRRENPLARRDRHAADGHVLRGEPVGRVVHGVREPEQLLDGRREQRRVRAQPGQLFRVGQQCQGAVADQVDRGAEAAHDDLEGQGTRLGAGQAVPGAVLADVVAGKGERREQVILGMGALGGDQLREVGGQLPRHAAGFPGPVIVGHRGRDPAAVRLRDAEQLAEHRARKRPGVRVEQVGDATGRFHLVQQASGDLLSPGRSRATRRGVNAFRTRRRSRVWARRVGVEQVRVNAARRLTRPLPGAARPVVDVVREPGVSQGRPCVRVAGDEPGPPAVRHWHRGDRPGLAQPREETRRVLVVGVFVEGHQLYLVRHVPAR
jgi:predicted RNA polymerase sigma factor